MNRRVGIITFHYSYNYGSVLQAYALKRLLELKGNDVSVINFIFDRDFKQYKPIRSYTNLKLLIKDVIAFKARYKRKINFINFQKKFLNLTKEYHNCNDMKELNQVFDIFVCGSDQIWNLDCTDGIEPAYFLKFANADKLKIAYAPSLAHQAFVKTYDDDLRDAIKEFDYLSIREKSTLPLIQPLTSKKIEIVLDPVLLLSANEYELIIQKKQQDNQYIFVYMLDYDEKLVKYSQMISAKMDRPLVYITGEYFCNISGKNLFGISPSDFLEYIKNAEYVITNSFHATVLSIIFEKKFITFSTKYSNSRVMDLLKSLGLLERMYHKNINIERKIDYIEVNSKLSDLRKKSLNFLNQALS